MMKEIFEYLRTICCEEYSLLRIPQQELWFEFNNIQIIVEFSDLENYELEEDYVDVTELDFTQLETLKINRIFIQKSNSLYQGTKDNPDKEYLEDYAPFTYQMYKIVNQMMQAYPDSVVDYSTKRFCIDDCGYEYGCPESWEYGFQIDMKSLFWSNKDFFIYIINDIDKNFSNFAIPAFYNTKNECKDNFEVKILNSNTKNRRLGYLKVMLYLFNEQTRIPISKINSKFETYSQNYNQYLEQYKNSKGNVVVTKTGYSAKPYIELAVNLGLIRKSAGVYEMGKLGKVYNILKDKLDKTETNPFLLSKFDITFFLELLLKEDHWFLYAILEQAATTPNISYKNLKKEFKQILLSQIKYFIHEAQVDKSNKALPLKVIERRINDWKRPEVYMEHILMPRLNWLYDMEFIDLKNDLSFQLTETGNRLLLNLSVWNDLALHKIVSPVAYMDNYFMKIIDFVFEKTRQEYKKDINNEFVKCIEDSFLLFKTLAPNRVTFSIFANYTKQILFWNYSESLDTEDIKKVFELKRLPKYIYKYQEHYKDGYIQKAK